MGNSGVKETNDPTPRTDIDSAKLSVRSETVDKELCRVRIISPLGLVRKCSFGLLLTGLKSQQ